MHAIISNKLELFSQDLDMAFSFHIFKENHTKYREYVQNLFFTLKNNLALVFRLNTIGTI